MAETIKVLGKPVNKNVVLVGGAAALGIVVYAWFKNSQIPEGLPEGSLPEPVPEPTDTPGFEVLGTAPAPMTNDQWATLAVEKLTNIGLDAPAVSAAIGKFLSRDHLTKTEASLVQQALAQAGQPPVGGPWSILEETTGSVQPPLTPPSRVSNLRAVGRSDATHYLLTWDPTPTATSYIVKGYNHDNGVWGPDWPETGTQHQAYLSAGHYTYYVSAVNAAGVSPSPPTSVSFTAP